MRSAPGRPAPETSALSTSVLKALEAFPGLKLVVLFGSSVHGRLREDSDVDVAVMGEVRLSHEERAAVTTALERATGRSVDLVDLQDAHGTLLEAVLREGLRLRIDRQCLLDLFRRHVFEQTDFMPAYRQALAQRRREFIRE